MLFQESPPIPISLSPHPGTITLLWPQGHSFQQQVFVGADSSAQPKPPAPAAGFCALGFHQPQTLSVQVQDVTLGITRKLWRAKKRNPERAQPLPTNLCHRHPSFAIITHPLPPSPTGQSWGWRGDGHGLRLDLAASSSFRLAGPQLPPWGG